MHRIDYFGNVRLQRQFHNGFPVFIRKDLLPHGTGYGLTSYMENEGSLETARQMAGHTSSRTTNMYVRIEEQMRQEEVERVRI